MSSAQAAGAHAEPDSPEPGGPEPGAPEPDSPEPGAPEPGRTGPGAGAGGPVAAETYLRLIAESELRQRPLLSGPGPHPHRVWLAAAILAAVAAVGPDVAWRVVSEFESAAGLRSGNLGPVLGGVRRPYRAETGAGRQRAAQPTAVPVGATLPLPAEREGWYGEFCLLSLARTDSQAALAVAARWAGQTRRAAGARPHHAPFYQLGAVDDRGVSYQAALWDMGVEDGRDWWDCHLSLDPAPPPGTQWLEVGPGAQGQRVRIDLTAPPGTVRVVTEPVPPASAATRLLDQAGDDLLGLESAGTGTSAQLEGRVRQVIRDLIGSGTLRADDPAVLRLSGLGWRLGLDLGSGGPVPARALPPAWISLLADGHAHDGPEAVAPFAADLPAIGGARFALAGLRSAAGGATLHVMASGWEPASHRWLVRGTGPAGRPADVSLSWRARDSTGRWHLVTGMVWAPADQAIGMIKMHLTPPLHPAATALDVIVTGPDRQIRATVPLGWAAGAPRPAPPIPPAAGPGQ
ncbi:MAG: hypothetical protein ACLP5E_19125 [Streptosporangiaceae bacterium]